MLVVGVTTGLLCAAANTAALADDGTTSAAGDAAASVSQPASQGTVVVAPAATTDATTVLSDLAPQLATQPGGVIDDLVGDTAATQDGVLDTSNAVVSLPSSDSDTATLTDPTTGQSLSVTPTGTTGFADGSGSDSGLAVADQAGEDASVLVQATTTGSLQALKVFSDGGGTSTFDLSVTKPADTEWQTQPNGSLQLVPTADAATDASATDTPAAPLAVVDAPWAVDAAGQALPTSYVVTNGGITQVIDTRDAVFPVVADPSWWWWATNIAGCAAEVATLAAAIVKLISVLSKAERVIKASRAALTAYEKLGGTVDKLWSLIKKYTLDRSSLTRVQMAAMTDLLKSVGNLVFNIIGIGTCWGIASQYL